MPPVPHLNRIIDNDGGVRLILRTNFSSTLEIQLRINNEVANINLHVVFETQECAMADGRPPASAS
jgi:hypothetical protein